MIHNKLRQKRFGHVRRRSVEINVSHGSVGQKERRKIEENLGRYSEMGFGAIRSG